MYNHVMIELNETNNNAYLSELDKSDRDEIMNDIVLPYSQEEDFFFDGRIINKNDILSIKIYETKEKSQTLARMENDLDRNNAGFSLGNSREAVVTYDRYSQDITKNILQPILKKSATKQNTISNINDKNKVFIVHGHDNEAKLEVARFIEKIGLKPIILHEQASNSQTIIEKIESNSDVGFGIVIYTPCDVGAKKSESSKLQNRARQNVIFEHGFLIGKLGRSNICSLTKGDIEKPNDIAGIVYISMDLSNWQVELAKEMRSSGYQIDMNKVI